VRPLNILTQTSHLKSKKSSKVSSAASGQDLQGSAQILCKATVLAEKTPVLPTGLPFARLTYISMMSCHDTSRALYCADRLQLLLFRTCRIVFFDTMRFFKFVPGPLPTFQLPSACCFVGYFCWRSCSVECHRHSTCTCLELLLGQRDIPSRS
jgi:hypothetical protein